MKYLWLIIPWYSCNYGATFATKQSSSQEIQLTFIYDPESGKFIPVVQKDPIADAYGSSMSSDAIASVFLLLIIMLSFIGNVLLVGTIASSWTLKRYPFNGFLMNLGIVLIVECFLNIIPSVIYIMTEEWKFGLWPCNIFSGLMELVPVVYVVILLALMLDRYLAAKDPSKYRKSPEASKHSLYIFFYWIFGIISVSPLISGSLANYPFPDRYSCQPMDELARVYGSITGGLCFVTSWFGLIVLAVMIHGIFQAERKKERKALRGREQTNRLAEPSLFMVALNHNVHFWNEIKNAGIVVVLLVAYLFLMVPYVIRVKVDQIVQSYNHDYYRNLTMAYYYDGGPSDLFPNNTTTTTISSSEVSNSTNSNSTESNDGKLQEINELPQVEADHLGAIDTVCVWLRYIHAVVVPLLIFLFHKDLRKKAEIILCCWRPNSVEGKKSSTAARESRPISAYMHQKRREWEKKQKKFKNVANFNVPVLFASSEGLYLRLIDDEFGPGTEQNNDIENADILDDSIKAQWSVEPRFVMEVCDLQVPMSASRGRTPASRGESRELEAVAGGATFSAANYGNNNLASENHPNFGTTVTVIVSKKESNLKSSLKKPKVISDEDEGFIDEISANNSTTDNNSAINKKVVQFKTQIEEIPILEAKSHHQKNRATVLPPLNDDEKRFEESPKKFKNQNRHSPQKNNGISPRRSGITKKRNSSRLKTNNEAHEMIELQLTA